MSRARRIAAYLASDTRLTYAQWAATRPRLSDVTTGEVVALVVLALVALVALVYVVTVGVVLLKAMEWV